MSKVALEKLAALVEDLQKQVATLSERVAKYEQAGAPEPEAPQAAAAVPEPPPSAAPAPAAVHQEAHEEISPEILLAISAAVAAYLGERAHVRAVRLISTPRWSQEGRVSIQASHQLNRG